MSGAAWVVYLKELKDALRDRRTLLAMLLSSVAIGPLVLPGNNYHVYDVALFWAAVRADMARRVAAWRVGK